MTITFNNGKKKYWSKDQYTDFGFKDYNWFGLYNNGEWVALYNMDNIDNIIFQDDDDIDQPIGEVGESIDDLDPSLLPPDFNTTT